MDRLQILLSAKLWDGLCTAASVGDISPGYNFSSYGLQKVHVKEDFTILMPYFLCEGLSSSPVIEAQRVPSALPLILAGAG